MGNAMNYITKGIGGFYYVKTPDGIKECKARGIFRKSGIKPVAGDWVELSPDGTVIDEIRPRKNVFVRPPIANLDVLFIVASTVQPVPSTLVLDQLAAAAIYKDVQPILVVTKADLGAADTLVHAYQTSGRHTTREVEIFEICGGRLADTPGFASLEAQKLCRIPKEDIQHTFPEFEPYLGQCRFTGCSHRAETDCAVRQAVEEGKISKTRYASYLAMYEEASARTEWEK